jgi:hypothetical protein
VQATLAAPHDLHDTRVLACLASSDALAYRRAMVVVVSGLDQQPAGVRRPGLGGLPLVRFSSEAYSLGTIPKNPESSAGFAKRVRSSTSARSPAAVSVSIPRKHRSRATVCVW